MSSEDIFSSGLDTTTVDTSNEFQPLPEGRYLVAIDSIEKVTPDADEEGMQADPFERIVFSVIQGEHQGRTIRFNCKLYSGNQQWREWALKDFTCMMKAVGVTRVTDAHRHSVVGKTLQVMVKINKGYNNIRDWFTAEGVPVRDGAGQGKAASAPPAARPAPAAAPRPAAAPTAAPRPATPPGAAPKFQPQRVSQQAAVPGAR